MEHRRFIFLVAADTDFFFSLLTLQKGSLFDCLWEDNNVVLKDMKVELWVVHRGLECLLLSFTVATVV